MTVAAVPSPTGHSRLAIGPLIAITIVLAISACGSAPPREASPVVELPGGEEEQLMQVTGPASLPPSVYSDQFARAEQALLSFDWMTAEAVLAELIEPLNTDDLVYRDYLRARIAYQRGQQETTDNILRDLPLPGTATALVIKLANFRAHIARMDRDYLASARIGNQLLQYSTDSSASAAIKRAIWRDLQHLPATTLKQVEGSAEDPQWRGWLDLAAVYSQPEPVAELRTQLLQWRQRNPSHPAANPLPGGLEYLVQSQPGHERVALLLPLSGRLAPAAKAVRDGYLASYYADRGDSLATNSLLVMDTGQYPSTVAAYDAAIAAGSTLVVGPLSKEAVTELAAHNGRSIPVLALNRVDQPLAPGSTALVQLALAPEDEAQRIAELAFGRGARRAMVLRPAGDWGNKMEQAVLARWRGLGGTVAATATYSSSESYSDGIKTALDLKASEQRARAVRDMLATNIESSGRRRQDMDVVFLLASSGDEARSIKPLLAFHYAGNLPVYATSNIYGGIVDNRDRDLNGVRVVDLPWLLGSNPGLRVAIAAGDTGSDTYTRLNALGADAHLLQTHFSQLQAGADALLRGDTGLLSMNPQLQIIREPQPAVFDGGELKPL